LEGRCGIGADVAQLVTLHHDAGVRRRGAVKLEASDPVGPELTAAVDTKGAWLDCDLEAAHQAIAHQKKAAAMR
jgi:hypothetical protein